MKSLITALLLSISTLLAWNCYAAEPMGYQSQSEEQRFRELSAELRCVMCQNQSLADSNAPIAHDLRLEIVKLMREGRDDDQIKAYLVARYTDFVLYQPPVKKSTWLLWLGPFVLLFLGLFVVIAVIRKNAFAKKDPTPSSNEEW